MKQQNDRKQMMMAHNSSAAQSQSQGVGAHLGVTVSHARRSWSARDREDVDQLAGQAQHNPVVVAAPVTAATTHVGGVVPTVVAARPVAPKVAFEVEMTDTLASAVAAIPEPNHSAGAGAGAGADEPAQFRWSTLEASVASIAPSAPMESVDEGRQTEAFRWTTVEATVEGIDGPSDGGEVVKDATLFSTLYLTETLSIRRAKMVTEWVDKGGSMPLAQAGPFIGQVDNHERKKVLLLLIPALYR